MCRRPLADVQKAFSRLFQQNVHRYTHGLSLLKTPAATLLEYFAPSFEHIPSQILSVTGWPSTGAGVRRSAPYTYVGTRVYLPPACLRTYLTLGRYVICDL